MLETDSSSQVFLDFRTYLKSAARDYWIIVSVTVACLAVVVSVQDGSPLMILRYLAGALLALGLPGFSLVSVLWSKKAGSEPQKGDFDWLLQAALSLVLSIVIVSLIVGILNFLPIGVGLISVSLSLSLFTVIFATFAALRNYRNQRTT